MAALDIDDAMLDGMVDRLRALSDDVDGAAQEAVRAGAQVLIEHMRQRVPVSDRHTKHLRDQIKIAHEGHDAIDGYFCEVYPDGVRPGGGKADGRRYATIGFVLEYGRSNMAARPWMRPAIIEGEDDVREAMRSVLARHLED